MMMSAGRGGWIGKLSSNAPRKTGHSTPRQMASEYSFLQTWQNSRLARRMTQSFIGR